MSIAFYDDPTVLFDDPSVSYDGYRIAEGDFPNLFFELNFDVGADAGYLIVGDPLRGIVGVGLVAPDLPESGTWVDVTDKTWQIDTSEGRQRLLDENRAGVLTATLDDTDGRFDPENLSGPYVSGGVSQADAMRGARLRAEYPPGSGNFYWLWHGFTDSFAPLYTDPAIPNQVPQTHLAATNAFKVMESYSPDADTTFGTVQRADEAIGEILDVMGWPSTERDLGHSLTMVGAVNWSASMSALQLAQLYENSDGGDLYMAPDGKVTFAPRWSIYVGRSATVQAHFSNDPDIPGLPYWSPKPVRDDSVIENVVTVQSYSNPPQTAENAASISKYLRKKPFQRTGLANVDPTQDLAMAKWLLSLNDVGTTRLDEIVLTPRSTNALWPVVLGLKKGDRIRYTQRPWSGDTYTLDGFVQGIDHHIGIGRDWTTVLHVFNAGTVPTDAFIVGQSLVDGPDLIAAF